MSPPEVTVELTPAPASAAVHPATTGCCTAPCSVNCFFGSDPLFLTYDTRPAPLPPGGRLRGFGARRGGAALRHPARRLLADRRPAEGAGSAAGGAGRARAARHP